MKSTRTYIIGYILSILLTLLAPAALWLHEAMDHQFPTHPQVYMIFVVLALLQLFVQLSFFLHVDQEAKPRWNLTALTFALIVVAILVGGTLWIMHNLSHGQMGSMQPFIDNQITPQNEND
jgi:cytochrome o ubiquinol oxidase operon protein cyoD